MDGFDDGVDGGVVVQVDGMEDVVVRQVVVGEGGGEVR